MSEQGMWKIAKEVPEGLQEVIVDLLYRLADDDLIMGHRNSEWTGLGPILEADIAMSSMAQDQIGQAAAYYRLLHELGEPDPDTNAFLRAPEKYRCASLTYLENGDWARSTMRLFLYETAKSLRLASLIGSRYVPLAQLARKLRGEQKYHLMHARMWIEKLGDATEESRRRMQTALDELYGHGLGLFERGQCDQMFEIAAMREAEAALQSAWEREVREGVERAGLRVPVHAAPVYGGRVGRHGPELVKLLNAMQSVYRLDPAAAW